MRYQAPRGTHDVLPGESDRWQRLERTFGDLAHQYGYREIRTPVFEDTDLFVRSSGETSDIVTKQMYTFRDKGDRSVTLKPEGTAPAIRSVIEHGLQQTGFINRLFYITPIFRYERPQKGRYRQSHQVGLELIGSSAPSADAEIIEITVRFFELLKISGIQVLLNSLGRDECRAKYREALLAFAAPFLQSQSLEVRDRVAKNPLRLLDSKDPDTIAALTDAPFVSSFLEDDSRAHFESLQQILTDASVPYVLAPGIVRGLDYYTGTVFEVQSTSLGAQSSLCGGGRYDGLFNAMGGSPTPSVGVGIGIERALIVMEAEGVSWDPVPFDLFVASISASEHGRVLSLARELRKQGLSVVIDLEGKSLKSQIRHAERLGIKWVAILGESEVQSSTVTMKDITKGEQQTVTQAGIKDFLKVPLP